MGGEYDRFPLRSPQAEGAPSPKLVPTRSVLPHRQTEYDASLSPREGERGGLGFLVLSMGFDVRRSPKRLIAFSHSPFRTSSFGGGYWLAQTTHRRSGGQGGEAEGARFRVNFLQGRQQVGRRRDIGRRTASRHRPQQCLVIAQP
jgi:hypothetical protein